MKKYKVYNIEYDIEPEDIQGIDEDDYAMPVDYIRACENEIEGIVDELPEEMTIKLEDDEPDVIDALLDEICDRTGWLIRHFDCESAPA